MLRRLLITCVISLLVVALIYFAAAWGLERLGRESLGYIRGALNKEGVRVEDVNFGSARLLPRGLGAHWSYWWAQITPPATKSIQNPQPLIFKAEALRVLFENISPLSVEFRLSKISIDGAIDPGVPEEAPFTPSDFPIPITKITDGEISLPTILVTEFKESYKTIARDIVTFVRTGKTSRDLTFKAVAHFRIKGADFAAKVHSERVDGVTYLRVHRADLDKISAAYERPLTEGEKLVVADYPLRAPTLLRVKNYAERTSILFAGTNDPAKTDPVRHVIWSYWLARLYGQEFSQRVTDAHEVGSTNTAAESQQDYANNAVGRAYAAAKKTEGEVAQLVKTDPRIVRSAK